MNSNEIGLEMVALMQERLSDDLWDRYYDEEIEAEKFELVETRLVEKWKREIEQFKKNCLKLGYSEADFSFIEREILADGLQYLENIKEV